MEPKKTKGTKRYSTLTNRLNYLPLHVLIAYLAFGVFISMAGPLEYDGYNKLPVLIFMGSFAGFFSLGYILGAKAPITVSNKYSEASLTRLLTQIFNWSILLSAFVTTFLFIDAIATTGLSLNIFKSGAAYFNAYDGYVRNTGSYSLKFIISSFGSVPAFITSIWGVYYFKTLSFSRKLLVLYTIVGTLIIFTVGGGKQKQFGDFVIYFASLYAISRASRNQLSFGFIVKILSLLLLAIMVLLTLLSLRYQEIGVDIKNLNGVIHPLIYFNENHIVPILLGDNIGFSVTILSGYFGQGYYGLSLALEQPFTWTAFSGSSYSLSVILNQFFGLPFMVEDSYPYLVADNTGWAHTKWHTGFAWLASDLTFPGTVLLGGGIGYLYAKLWREAILLQNPLSILLFCLLSVGAAYMPANNQLMHSPGALFTLFTIVYLYFWLRGVVNYYALRRKSLVKSPTPAKTTAK